MLSDDISSRLRQATGRPTVAGALAWIAEGHPLNEATPQVLLEIVLQIPADHEHRENALRRLVREACRSEVDTAAVLFSVERVPSSERFRNALDLLARKNRTGTLNGLTATAVIAAQREDGFTIETLCEVAGLSYRDLKERLPQEDLPGEPTGTWPPSALRAAFAVVDSIVQGTEHSRLPGTTPVRPIEHLQTDPAVATGWTLVERLRRERVPYELLLAQRHVGSAWLAHRNRTSSEVNRAIATRLCDELDARDTAYVRSAAIGGRVPQRRVSELSGGGREITLVGLRSDGTPTIGVIFSTARDSGSARTTARKLRAIRDAAVPVALVVSGAGWAARETETAALAAAFDGRLFSDTSLATLAAEIGSTVRTTSGKET